jgi:NADH-quinone oxidoreductase subunit H
MAWLDSLTPQTQFVIFTLIKIACAVGALLTMVAYSVLVERKVSAFIQDRVGPNRTAIPWIAAIPVLGPFLVRLGIFQPLADGLKFILKEDFMPAHVRKIYFWLAPAVAMVPAFLTIAVIPFGSTLGNQKMVIADLNVGVLYTFGIVSLAVYGIVLAGYSANSKYPFFGGIRSSAQMISYEITMGMSVIPVFLLSGTLNLSELIVKQSGWHEVLPLVPNWYVFQSPMTFLAFVIFLIAAFAETNRLPFDMPECETELVGGYHTEYSSMKFALFFLGEYAAMIAVSALMVVLFFGGWTLPFFGLDQMAGSIGMGIVHIGVFIGKMLFFMVVFIWVRWMIPRFRYDQLMDLGWKRILPVALVNIILTAAWLWWRA